MNIPEAVELRDHACERKVPLGRRAALSLAERRRAESGEKISAYRCPFGVDHWHIGHVPSIQNLQRIADAIRVLAQQTELRDT